MCVQYRCIVCSIFSPQLVESLGAEHVGVVDPLPQFPFARVSAVLSSYPVKGVVSVSFPFLRQKPEEAHHVGVSAWPAASSTGPSREGTLAGRSGRGAAHLLAAGSRETETRGLGPEGALAVLAPPLRGPFSQDSS